MLRRAQFYVLMFILTLIPQSYSYVYNDNHVEMIVYRDGLVHVMHKFSCNETYPAITIELLASKVDNVLVLDENNTLLDYEIANANITVYSLGAREIIVEYDTFELTSMEAGVWTLTFSSPYNLTVKLPEGATIIYLSDVPTIISTEGNRTVLHLPLGLWEISYVLPTKPLRPETSGSQEEPSGEVKPSYPVEIIAVGVLVALFIALGAFILLKKRSSVDVERVFRRFPKLKDEEKKVLEFIASIGGRAFEAELRKAFPEIPRTTLWRMVRRLESMGILRVKKIGIQNQVELIRG